MKTKGETVEKRTRTEVLYNMWASISRLLVAVFSVGGPVVSLAPASQVELQGDHIYFYF